MAASDSSINGFVGFKVPIEPRLSEECDVAIYRSKVCWPWGWGTNRTAWASYADNITNVSLYKLIDISRRMSTSLLTRASWVLLLRLTQQEKNKSWFFRWQLNCLARDLTFLIPSENLVSNRGCDSSGTHTSAYKDPSHGIFSSRARVFTYTGRWMSRHQTNEFYRTVLDVSYWKLLRMVASAAVPKRLFLALRSFVR
jgi:hypothetical protein